LVRSYAKPQDSVVCHPGGQRFVILSVAKNLVFSTSSRSFTAFRMTKNRFCNSF
jgi:hypothetical protein